MGVGREKVVKKEFYFDPNCYPSNYDSYIDKKALKSNPSMKKDYKLYPAGCTTYENFFSHEEMQKMEI